MKLPVSAVPSGRAWQVIDADGYIVADILTGSYDQGPEQVAGMIVGALNGSQAEISAAFEAGAVWGLNNEPVLAIPEHVHDEIAGAFNEYTRG